MQRSTEFFLISATGLALDQGLKYFGAGWFSYYLNTNFAWSWPVSNRAVVILTWPLILLVAGFFYRRPAIWLILAGAVSNLIDRLGRGGVVDYIWLPGGGVINLADVLILAGLLFLIIEKKHVK